MLPFIILLQTAVVSPLAVRPDTARPHHDALHYDITVVLADSGRHVLGEVQTDWRLRSDQPIEVQLDSSMRVVRVLINGRENTRLARTRWGRDGEIVVIPHEGKAGDSLSTRIRYHGEVVRGLTFHGTKAQGLAIFGDNWPDRAHGWLPVEDFPGDKATVSFHVQAPAPYQVIANGTLQSIDTLAYGHLVWNYRMDRPIPVYTMVFAVGRFSVARLPDAACEVRCVPQTLWTAPDDSAYAAGGPFRRVGEIVDFFSGLIGPFPYPGLAHVEALTPFGGMENSTAIFYNDSLYRARKLPEQTVAHETAHQWFGDAVTEGDWHHLWLSEGFATYLAAMWAEHADGPAAFTGEMRRAADAYFKSAWVDRPVLDTTVPNLDSLLNENNYQKGSWVLHQLRGLIGDSAFAAGLRSYYTTYKDGTALSSDLAQVMASAAGRDLDWYFRQALTQPGYPVLDLRWRHSGGKLVVDVVQTQKPEWGTYRMPGLELAVDGKIVRLDIEGRETHATIDGISRAPTTIVVDPRGWWLARSSVTKAQ
ncbi:MAG TPA: M1 family metallopeptidase [Gemmatimonadales bacterium]